MFSIVYCISQAGESIAFYFLCFISCQTPIPRNFQTTLLPFVFLPSPNVSRRAVIVFAGSFPCIIIVLLIYYANCVINPGKRRKEGGKKKIQK